MDRNQSQANGQPGKARGRARSGRTQNDRDEQEGHHRFEHKRRHQGIFAQIARSIAILTQTICRHAVIRLAAGNKVQHARANNGTDCLGHGIAHELAHGHTSGQRDTQTDGRVQMCARNCAQAIGCRNNRQPEGKRDAHHADLCPHQDRRSTAEKHQDHGSQCLGKKFLVHLRPFLFRRFGRLH